MTGLYERESRSVSTLAHLRFFPQAVTGGKGSMLRGDDGRDLLDFAASWGAASLGHGHPALAEAVNRALSDQAGASYLSTANEPSVLLAEKLLSLVPERAAGRVDGVRPGCAVAVRLDAGMSRETFAVAVECTDFDDPEQVRRIQRQVAHEVIAEVDMRPRNVVVLAPGTIPKTPSGKLRRAHSLALVN